MLVTSGMMLLLGLDLLLIPWYRGYEVPAIIFSMATMYLALHSIIVMSMNHNQKLRNINGYGIIFFKLFLFVFVICCIIFTILFSYNIYWYYGYPY